MTLHCNLLSKYVRWVSNEPAYWYGIVLQGDKGISFLLGLHKDVASAFFVSCGIASYHGTQFRVHVNASAKNYTFPQFILDYNLKNVEIEHANLPSPNAGWFLRIGDFAKSNRAGGNVFVTSVQHRKQWNPPRIVGIHIRRSYLKSKIANIETGENIIKQSEQDKATQLEEFEEEQASVAMMEDRQKNLIIILKESFLDQVLKDDEDIEKVVAAFDPSRLCEAIKCMSDFIRIAERNTKVVNLEIVEQKLEFNEPMDLADYPMLNAHHVELTPPNIAGLLRDIVALNNTVKSTVNLLAFSHFNDKKTVLVQVLRSKSQERFERNNRSFKWIPTFLDALIPEDTEDLSR